MPRITFAEWLIDAETELTEIYGAVCIKLSGVVWQPYYSRGYSSREAVGVRLLNIPKHPTGIDMWKEEAPDADE